MNQTRITVLELYCGFKGWQGGTIHQAKSDFLSLTASGRLSFLTILNQNKNNLPPHAVWDVQWFVNNAGDLLR